MAKTVNHAVQEKHRLAAFLLSRGKSCAAVSRELGITERTLYRWRQRPQVQAEITRMQSERMDEVAAQTTTFLPDALTVLTTIMADPDARAADRIQACRTLMSSTTAYQERKVLERQISGLETQLKVVAGVPDGSDPDLIDDALLLTYAGSSEDEEAG